MKNNHYIIPQWPAPSYVKAYSTLRSDGYSRAPFDAFNFGEWVGDDIAAVHKNRERLQQELNFKDTPCWLKQVHGTRVIDLGQPLENKEADASFSMLPYKVCVVTTADCLPLLVCSSSFKKVAAIHAGWKGLLGGVIEMTIEAMMCEPEDVMIWIGPGIHQKNFEVGEEVKNSFCEKNIKNKEAFIQNEKGYFQANLHAIARRILNDLGIHKIYGEEFCTYENPDLFYSYRRDGVTGRMASLIWFEP